MRLSIVSICSLFIANASVYEMTPEQPAQIRIIIDGDMATDTIHQVGNETVTQLSALATLYEQAGFPFEVGFVFSVASDPKTCEWASTPSTDPITYLEDIQELIANHTGDHTSLETTHRTQNAIWLTASSSFDVDDAVRRVIVFYTDRVEAFGEADESVPCAGGLVVSEETFADAIEGTRTALLYSALGDQAAALQKQGNALYKTKAGLSDLFVDEYTPAKNEFDTIEWHLRRLLSSAWIASTSTTTQSPLPTTPIPTTNTPTVGAIIKGCKAQMASTLKEWLLDCQEKCEFYGTSPGTAWCGVPSSVDDLVECVLKYNSDHCFRA